MKYQLIKWVTIVLQLGLLGALFIPFIHDYELSSSLWDIIQDGYRTGSLEDVLTFMLYYVPVAIGALLVLLLESRIRYGISLLSAAMGLTLTLTQYLFPALAAGYSLVVYQMGLYVLLGLQCAVILFSLIGICSKGPAIPAYLQPVNPSSDTAEILLPESVKKKKKNARHMAK